MKFSVIVPLYNKEKHIVRTIESVLNQTYKDFELVIIDDGSTDDSYDIAAKIKDERIYVYKQENKGASVARNKGVMLSRGKFVAFLDADDTWYPDYLQTIAQLVDKYTAANYFATSYEYYYDEGEITPTKKFFQMEKNWEGVIDDFFKIAYDGPILCSSCTVVSREAFNAVGGFKDGIKLGEDIDLWTALGLEYKLAYKNKVCATYHCDAQNRSQDKKHLLDYDFASYVEEKYLQNQKYNGQSIYFKEYLIRVVLDKINYLIAAGQNGRARKLMLKYRYSKLYKRHLIRAYVASYISYKQLERIARIIKK